MYSAGQITHERDKQSRLILLSTLKKVPILLRAFQVAVQMYAGHKGIAAKRKTVKIPGGPPKSDLLGY